MFKGQRRHKKYGAVNEKFAMANRNNFDILF